jgi:murein DD-endopeptidase MepM/ murein hydrolase activator NlpD
MKLILIRERGFSRTIHISRRRLAAFAAACLTGLVGVAVWMGALVTSPRIDADVVDHWRSKLSKQDVVVSRLEEKSQAQSEAVGRQLAEMQARLLRMEALGAHMADAAQLEVDEFDFNSTPAQGGPVSSLQHTLNWSELQDELVQLSDQLKRRETELSILDSVLVTQDIDSASVVAGRPVKWGWLSSQFGKRVDPLTGKTAWHSGVDFAGRDGSDVIAVASGVVTFAGERSGYGKIVEISHADGYVTRYAHHKDLSVSAGEVVKQGETIGTMGSSGRSTGPHVHFEVLKNGRTVDPANYVSRRRG